MDRSELQAQLNGLSAELDSLGPSGTVNYETAVRIQQTAGALQHGFVAIGALGVHPVWPLAGLTAALAHLARNNVHSQEEEASIRQGIIDEYWRLSNLLESA